MLLILAVGSACRTPRLDCATLCPPITDTLIVPKIDTFRYVYEREVFIDGAVIEKPIYVDCDSLKVNGSKTTVKWSGRKAQIKTVFECPDSVLRIKDTLEQLRVSYDKVVSRVNICPELNWWEKFKIATGGFMLAGYLIMIALTIIKYVIKP